MEDEEFEKILELVNNGDALYQNMFTCMEDLLDNMSQKLTEEEFDRFRDKLKSEFLEKL